MVHLQLLLCIFFFSTIKTQTTFTFRSCNAGGFTCYSYKQTLQFECPKNYNHAKILMCNINNQNTNLVHITLMNCPILTVNFDCASSQAKFLNLTIYNITTLFFDTPKTATKPPLKLALRNINYIESIPTNLFHPNSLTPGKFQELSEVHFQNVTINTIEEHAFYNLTNITLFEWDNVTINEVHAKAVKLDMKGKSEFIITNSRIDNLEHLAFQIYGEKASWTQNELGSLAASAFNGTLETFEFSENRVEIMQSNAISLLTKHSSFSFNVFKTLFSGAFSNIGPGLLQNTHLDFAKLDFSYTFTNNHIFKFEVGSLNPNVQAYERVRTNMYFYKNIFECNCENTAWIFSELSHGMNSKGQYDFTKNLLNNDLENKCIQGYCLVGLSVFGKYIKNGCCSFNGEKLCGSNVSESSTFSPEYYSTVQFYAEEVSLGSSKYSAVNSILFIVLSLLVFYY